MKNSKKIDQPDDGQIRTGIAKQRTLKALEACAGVVTDACKMAKVARSVFYTWMKDDKQFAASVQDVGEVALDIGESALFKLINGLVVTQDRIVTDGKGKKSVRTLKRYYPPDTQAVIFLLSTKGKTRGYIKQPDIQLPDVINHIRVTREVINSKDDLKT